MGVQDPWWSGWWSGSCPTPGRGSGLLRRWPSWAEQMEPLPEPLGHYGPIFSLCLPPGAGIIRVAQGPSTTSRGPTSGLWPASLLCQPSPATPSRTPPHSRLQQALAQGSGREAGWEWSCRPGPLLPGALPARVSGDEETLTWGTRAPRDSLACCGTEKPRWAGQAPAHVWCSFLCIPSASRAGPLPGVLGASRAKVARGAEVTKGESLLEEEGPVEA